MLNDDPFYLMRLQAIAAVQQLGSVQLACRVREIPRSTYYRWRKQMLQHGREILRPRQRRAPRMPNATPPFVEEQLLAFALGHPGFGPQRISDELRREKWGRIMISPNGVWRVLRRHGLNTRERRLRLVAGYAAPALPPRPQPQPERHLEVAQPSEIVRLACFYIGRLAGTKGTVWQYTATDGFSASSGRRAVSEYRCQDRPGTPAEVQIPVGEAGQTKPGLVLCHQVRTVSLLRARPDGPVRYVTDPDIRTRVREALAMHLGLDIPGRSDGASVDDYFSPDSTP